MQEHKKGLFALKPPTPKETPSETSINTISYRDYGFGQASALRGNLPGLKVSLQKLYYLYRQSVQDDDKKQEALKQPYRIKIEDYKGHSRSLEQQIKKIDEEKLPSLKSKIAALKADISHIRNNPHELIGDDAGKAGYIIGGIILVFLTIYLFIFYSSASYSAFFKEFTLNQIGLASSIFDAKALSNALNDGTTELILILTIPFAFLALGYLIHRFQEQKSRAKYGKIGALILVTFIFDCILAYEITEKIYNIKKTNSFLKDIPEYTFRLAFESMSFWLIIFAGFMVYLIWGFVFDFVMESHGKKDKVKVAIREKQKQIRDHEAEIKETETLKGKLEYTVSENEKEVNKLKAILEGHIIPRDFEQDIYQFMAGWLAWMEQANKPADDITAAHNEVDSFLKISIVDVTSLNRN